MIKIKDKSHLEGVEIQILGRILKINCPIKEQYALGKAVEDLNNRLRNLQEKSKVTNIEHLSCITSLNLLYELTQEKIKTKNYIHNIKRYINLFQTNIDKILEEDISVTETDDIQFK